MNLNILIIDQEKQSLEGFSKLLNSVDNEFKLFFSSESSDALYILDNNKIDVIVCHITMPKINGIELLNIIKEKHPKVIRILFAGFSGNEVSLKVADVVHQFLVKPFNGQSLKRKIENIVFLQNILQNEKLLSILNGIDKLPSLPDLFIALEKESQSPMVSLRKISEIISKDVTMTVKILKLVNSAFFSIPMRVLDAQQAVNFLGIEIIKSLVLVEKTFVSKEFDRIPKHLINELWDHSFQTAKICKELTYIETNNREMAESAYICAVMHDIGKLIIWKIIPDYLKRNLQPDEYKSIDFNYEYDVLGTSHAEIGAYLLGLWGFPMDVIEGISFHHILDTNLIDKFSINIALYISNLLTQQNKSEYFDLFMSLPLNDKSKEYIKSILGES